MKTIKQWAAFLVWFVLVFGCLRAWKVDGSEGAGNLVQMVLWLGVALCVCLGFSDPQGVAPRAGRVLVIVRRASMLVLILALAWYGHFALALAQAFGWLCAVVYFKQYGPDGKPLPSRTPSAEKESSQTVPAATRSQGCKQ